MNPNTTIPSTGAVTPPTATKPAVKRIELPTGPVTGRTGEAVLAEAITNAFLEPAAGNPEPEGAAGNPAPATPQPGADGVSPENEVTPENAEEPPAEAAGAETAAAIELSAEEQAALADRAKANGVTVAEQQAAEAKELARLEAKAKAEGKTVEEVAAEEEAAAAPGEKTFTQTEVEELIQQRVKNQAARIAALEKQLASGPVIVAETGPLGHVNTAAELTTIAERIESAIEEADDNLAALGTDPEGVEEYLRKQWGAEADKQDYSPKNMAAMLRNAKRNLKTQLAAVPARQAYLDVQAQMKPVMAKVAPWLADETDARTVSFKALERAMPHLKAAPTWEYWMALAVDRHLELQKAKPAAAAKPAGKFVPKVTFPKTTARATSPAPRPATGKARVAELKAALAADPTNEKKLEALLAAQMSG
jgi:hypothetical protein